LSRWSEMKCFAGCCTVLLCTPVYYLVLQCTLVRYSGRWSRSLTRPLHARRNAPKHPSVVMSMYEAMMLLGRATCPTPRSHIPSLTYMRKHSHTHAMRKFPAQPPPRLHTDIHARAHIGGGVSWHPQYCTLYFLLF